MIPVRSPFRRLISSARNRRPPGRGCAVPGFSLIEVVVAVGLLSFALVAILGLMSATTRSAAELAEAEGLASLGAGVQRELERIKASVGLNGLSDLVPEGASSATLCFVGTRDGRRVLRADGADPVADRWLDDPALPGIANRDRFFLVELTRLSNPSAIGASGFVALGARCSWPYLLPTGPATSGATRCDADPVREVPSSARRLAFFNFAIRP
jgi:type II secretory pathway pseudopilin PulG